MKKTLFTIPSRKSYHENEYVKLGTHSFETVKDFTYHGTILTNKNKFTPEIVKRIIIQVEHNMYYYFY